MKKGISLIVLVITIIVMIIIAGAIIISLNSSNVIDSANEAKTKTDVATLNDKLTLAYVDLKTAYIGKDTFTAAETVSVGSYSSVTLEEYYTAIIGSDAIPDGHVVEIYENGAARILPTASASGGIATF